jgi:hypothetical protein
LLVATLAGFWVTAMALESLVLIDDRSSGNLRALNGNAWRLITDGVMGGVSRGQLTLDSIEGRPCLRLRGDVRVENSGGFIQAALDTDGKNPLDASGYSGVLLEVYGNGEQYNLHLRSVDVWLPWQAYRASFTAPAAWRTVRIPFSDFRGYRIGAALDTSALERFGLLGIGRAFTADLCLGKLALYRHSPTSD